MQQSEGYKKLPRQHIAPSAPHEKTISKCKKYETIVLQSLSCKAIQMELDIGHVIAHVGGVPGGVRCDCRLLGGVVEDIIEEAHHSDAYKVTRM